MEAVLKRWGHPVLVAARYQPTQHLIGPALFPMYKLALQAVFLFYLVPWLLVWLGLAMFDPGYRAAHPGPSQLRNLWSWWSIAVNAFALITVVFAVVGTLQATPSFLHNWSPRKLPAVPDPNRIPAPIPSASWSAASSSCSGGWGPCASRPYPR